MKKYSFIALIILTIILALDMNIMAGDKGKPVHYDAPFLQDYSIKYYFEQPGISLKKVAADRNGKIQVLSSEGLLHPHDGAFLYPGTLEKDGTYRPMADKNLKDLASYQQQLVYLDEEAVLSNAWAGKPFLKHQMPGANLFAGAEDFTFMVVEGRDLKLLKGTDQLWKGKTTDQVLDLKYVSSTGKFWILTPGTLQTFSPQKMELETVFKGMGFTAFDVVAFGTKTIIGTANGYIEVNNLSKTQAGSINSNLPVSEILKIKEVGENVWFGSPEGAFMLRDDGKFNYYFGERWLPGNRVIDMAEGPDNSVLILTDKGLAQICMKEITLHKKAMYFEKQVRLRHIRNGFNATLNGMKNGDLSTGHLSDSDNDGLWTSMYLGSQVFRYAVTHSEEALQNCIESLDAMERLYTINPVPGFPSRSFERSGYINILSDPERWQHSPDPEWDWKATTSSDEAIGHVFVFGAIAELVDVEPVRAKAVRLLDGLMQHIVDNDFYLVDYDGKPTTWGRWNPEYVNGFPTSVGDRKLNSSNIVAMLQTAYHFTKKEIYKEKAFELMHDYGYLENLMRPMEEIGKAPENSGDWAQMLSSAWNHSDDEMYFLGYWGLDRYAFNDTLKTMFRESIMDHWELERPEKDGLWNLFTAMVSNEFDLEEAVWYLQEYPMDLISWTMKNSHRKDIRLVTDNFRKQTTEEVLPPDELPVRRHNANRFGLDGGNNGHSESSAGDIWLLPYWLGRYLGVIECP
ncbi:hypothetical protein D1164_14310 [Mariniphaga sediminis]|uniref:Uncharacterized protein n=1 Tax=Mariniphaga sediminis TaxID=1628158 RepID=A0A399CZ83_9BACT|nr:hypothetical protein [Mariniphaga sediminis]RIH64526.1 hypothetical protein D1164_14310 [Mariniphaga sediminis]